ncbi:MAG: transcriptional regulator GcvA [Rhodospirillaceae bacterium]|nr:transcriptional regulator GcvA [Rhodospirillaceae bacterium]
MKRDLPPLSALRAFEAAARHLSFRSAAEELGLTQSAISHQVTGLEDHFGLRLFDRAGRRVALSEAGRILFPFLRDGFDRMTQGADLLRRARMSEDLRVQVYVTVAVRWLIPRLHRFQSANPNVVVRVNTSVLDWEFDPDIADLGMICTAAPDRPGLHYDHLFDALLFPVCTPAVAQGGLGLRQPVDLVNHALLQVYTTANDWQLWLDAAGVPNLKGRAAAQFDSYLLAIEAALDGQGVALAPHFMVAEDLKLGRLVRPFAVEVRQPARWYLVCPTDRLKDRPIEAFRAWLKEEVGKDPAMMAPAPG